MFRNIEEASRMPTKTKSKCSIRETRPRVMIHIYVERSTKKNDILLVVGCR